MFDTPEDVDIPLIQFIDLNRDAMPDLLFYDA